MAYPGHSLAEMQLRNLAQALPQMDTLHYALPVAQIESL